MSKTLSIHDEAMIDEAVRLWDRGYSLKSISAHLGLPPREESKLQSLIQETKSKARG